MARDQYSELQAFIAVARHRSFTKAANEMGLSQSALSHTIRGLEKRLGIRLLTRTTRSVSPTDAGQRLIDRVAIKFEDIDAELAALTEMRDKPAGMVRISCSDHAAEQYIWPRLKPLLREYQDIQLEVRIDYGLTNIVEERLDAGVRLGEQLEQDMIAIPIMPKARMLVAASPDYLKGKSLPLVPQELLEHQCINIRLPTFGGNYAWEFEKDGRELKLQVSGQVTFTNVDHIIQAALDGFGFAFMPQESLAPHVKRGDLITVLEDWTPSFTGLYLYYPNRREASPAFKLVAEALRYNPELHPMIFE